MSKKEIYFRKWEKVEIQEWIYAGKIWEVFDLTDNKYQVIIDEYILEEFRKDFLLPIEQNKWQKK